MLRTVFLTGIAAYLAAALAAQDTSRTKHQRTIEFTGLILVNGFYNNGKVNNSDVPQLAELDTNGVSGIGGTIRQTRLGVFLTDPDVLGGTLSGEIDADFFGGQQASTGGRTFPLLRLRRAVGTLQWTHFQLLVGQESPLVAERSPRSFASVGFPDFAGAGNLWLWLPQARVTGEIGETLRLAVQGAVLAPNAGTAQGAFLTQPDSAERTSRPYLEGRVRLGWGPRDDPSEVAVGGHYGWLRGQDSTTGDTLIVSSAVTVDLRISLGMVEILGEGFSGQALAGLGGGGIGQNTGVGGVPVRSKGGWGQVNLRPVTEWTVGGGCGLDDPDDADVRPVYPGTAPTPGRFRNFVCEGHVHWRPGPVVVAFEFRRLSTRYDVAGVKQDFTVNHLDLAMGYRF